MIAHRRYRRGNRERRLPHAKLALAPAGSYARKGSTAAVRGSPVNVGDKNSYDFFDLNVRGTFEVFGSRRAEGFPPRLPVNLYNQESHVLSAAMCAMSESR
jgi:hypothetical protein